MFPPLPPLRVAIETIPPARSRIATTIPADPPASPFASSVLLIPAAHDWKLTKTNKMIDSIHDTSFHVFISFPSFLYDFFRMYLFNQISPPYKYFRIKRAVYLWLEILDELHISLYNFY